MKKFIIISLAISSLVFIFLNKINPSKTIIHKTDNQDSNFEYLQLNPKEIVEFKIDNLNNTTTVYELRVPDNYSKEKDMPLFVWFAPNKGSNKISKIPPFVDFKEFFILALPYLDNSLPRIAIRDGYINDFWEYNKPMLEFVLEQIPNISSDVKIAGGFSSGAHYVASGLDMNWEGFTDFFTGYILHEGGYAPHMSYEGIYPSDEVLVTYGANVDDNPVKIVAEIMKQNHSKTTVYELPNTVHNITPETIAYIRSWVKEKFNYK